MDDNQKPNQDDQIPQPTLPVEEVVDAASEAAEEKTSELKVEKEPEVAVVETAPEPQPEETQPEETPAEKTENTETTPAETSTGEENTNSETPEEMAAEEQADEATVSQEDDVAQTTAVEDDGKGRWYVVHTFSGHENKVATNLRQRIDSEHLENKIFDILVPTQDKIEIRSGKKEQVKEKIFPGYILVKMDLDDLSWLAVRTTQGVTGFVGMSSKPTPIPDREVASIVKFMTQGAAPTFKDVFLVDDTVKIIDGPFAEFIGKVESVDKEKGKVRVLVSIFGRETPVELDFLQVTKL